jgi:hypothetical protein
MKRRGYAGAGYRAAPARTRLAGVFLRAAEEISASNVMVDADLSAAQAADVLFRPIRARAVKRIRVLTFDAFDFETLMQAVP